MIHDDLSATVFSPEVPAIAVISDIHGNQRALEAVLADIAALGIEAIACNGDLITSSAHSVEVVQRIRSLAIPCTRGNHERYLMELADPRDSKWRQANWSPTRHDYEILSPSDRGWLQQLPSMVWLVGGSAPLFMSHAGPGNDTVRLTRQTPAHVWDKVFRDLPQGATLVGSHLHWFWQYRWPGHHFIRTPAAGLPLDGDVRAGYVILRRRGRRWLVEHRRVAYDHAGELAAFHASDFYREGGIVAHLFWEELRTARSWLMPFFAHASRYHDRQGISQDQGYTAAQLESAWHTFQREDYPEYAPDAPGCVL